LNTLKDFESQIYTVNDRSFEDIALSLFRFQANNNSIYRQYIENLGIDTTTIKSVHQIPFLPISFFKNQTVKTGDWTAETIFTSSGTTGLTTSTRYVKDLEFYLSHAEKCFKYFFGDLSDYHFLGYLPSYLERSNSSLVAMIDRFIKKSQSNYSGFYLHDTDKLVKDLEVLRNDSRKTILWGVSFALLDLIENFNIDLSHCMIFETGGMKGRRKEMTRQELHSQLTKAFHVNTIYSEYGMTELFSQAYSKSNDFACPPWMKILVREITDPRNIGLLNETGAINVIDLSNIDSVAFIETEDIGKVRPDGYFEVLGRMDNSDVRGCNLLV
jgi:phenylacetate-coenzyme A ligase PaaK-like adenylate-forming protein